MTTTKTNTPKDKREDLSYFTLTLQSFLNESFPELAADKTFVQERADLAAQTYADALLAGHTHPEAAELSNAVMYEGLEFSKFDTLFKVVCEEFSAEIPDEELRPFVLKVYPHCQEVFDKYNTDEPYFNLFSDYAGTEVGTDLIILQKQTGKGIETLSETLFVESETVNGISQNLFFDSPEKIIHTRQEIGTDLYGKPAVTKTRIFIENLCNTVKTSTFAPSKIFN